MTAKVIVNRSRQVAILAKQGHKYVHVIRAIPRGLVVDKLTEDELLEDWSELAGYKLEIAVMKFAELVHGPRTTRAARVLLHNLATELLNESEERA